MMQGTRPDTVTGLLQQGRFEEAERTLRERLADEPQHLRLLRQLGTLCHVTGRGDEALDLLERALALEPCNATTLINLGSVHMDAGNLAAAHDCFQRAAQAEPESSDACFNLGVAQQQMGQHDDAEASYREALRLEPGLTDAAVNLAAVNLELGRCDASREIVAGVLRAHPDHTAALALDVRALLALDRLDEAERAVDRAPDPLRGSSTFQALAGRVLFRTGRLQAAVAAYTEARRLGDTQLATAHDLSRCLLESGHAAEAVSVLEETARRHPGDTGTTSLLGLAQLDAAQPADALATYERAIAIEPDNADHHEMRAQALAALSRGEAAEAAAETAIELAPGRVGPYLLQVEQRIARGAPADALAACDRFLNSRGPECSLLAAKGFLLHALGLTAQGDALVDFDRLIRIERISTPPGYDSVADFNAALARHIRAHPTLSLDNAASRATQIGRQSGNLFHGEKGPFAAFETLLWQAAERYRTQVGTDPGHPFLARPPPLGAVHSWAVVLERAGYQTPHIHPTAWLSGVYYPELPALIREGGSEQGWIEFGAPPPELAMTPAAPTRRIRPEEGLMVLFPSYFYHRTVPCESDEQRLSVAFDFSPQL